MARVGIFKLFPTSNQVSLESDCYLVIHNFRRNELKKWRNEWGEKNFWWRLQCGLHIVEISKNWKINFVNLRIFFNLSKNLKCLVDRFCAIQLWISNRFSTFSERLSHYQRTVCNLLHNLVAYELITNVVLWGFWLQKPEFRKLFWIEKFAVFRRVVDESPGRLSDSERLSETGRYRKTTRENSAKLLPLFFEICKRDFELEICGETLWVS